MWRTAGGNIGRWLRLAVSGAVLTLVAIPVAFGQAPDNNGSTFQPPDPAGAKLTTKKPQGGENEKGRLVNPITGMVSAPVIGYAPLTASERWKVYVEQTYASVGAYVGPMIAATIDQANDTPYRWGSGLGGYARRAASRVAVNDVLQNSFQASAAALLKFDVRYIPSHQHGFGRRVEHAFIYSFVNYNRHGQTTLNLPSIGGYYFASGISTIWLPGIRHVPTYTLIDGSKGLALSVPLNMVQEFWPDISHKFQRK